MQKLFTFKEVATQLSVSQEFLRKLQRKNLLTVVRIGRAVRIPEAEVCRLCGEETPPV